MKRVALTILAAAILLTAAVACPVEAAEPTAEPPADRVVAMYFHRTERCPTCLKMGSYTEEAVKKGFAEQVKGRSVEFHYIDFQNKKNAALTKGYKVTGPALIVVQVKDGKVKEYKDLKDIWTKVGEKTDFLAYVRENVTAYQK